MDAIECLKKRRSVRSFTDKEISKEILKEIIDCARLAPSARNDQKWEFVVITDKKMLTKVASLAEYGRFIKDAAACVLICCDKDYKYKLEDCCAATENILLAARAYSIGSCWVAGYGKEYVVQLAKEIGLHEDVEIISTIGLGYTEKIDSVKGPSKRELKEVLHWEKY